MPEHDALVGAYEHLHDLPRAAEALHSLRKIASLVKPIMRSRGWRVATLAEFYPGQSNLLGININRGQKICLRLRYPGDKTQFLPLEQVVDTMLHELSHNVHGSHNEQFHALWNSLREEHEDLLRKGYSGEGFLSNGQRLGGRRMPMHEMRRQARASAERRAVLQKGSGQKLGGAAVRPGADMRRVIADAASRRIAITTGCASGTKEGEEAANAASRNGFRTQAEEDDANERAIAQALWELVQEEESRKLGVEGEPWRTDGLIWNPETGLVQVEVPPSQHTMSTALQPSQGPSLTDRPDVHAAASPQAKQSHFSDNSRNARPVSRLIAESEKKRKATPHRNLPRPADSQGARPTHLTTSQLWACPTCTLANPTTYLCCDACGVERPGSTYAAHQPISSTGKTESSASRSERSESKSRLGWNCRSCGTFMESQWWTCSVCGRMKASS